jgi:hypothetical protein
MKARGIALLFAGIVVFAGCFEDKCKNVKVIEEREWKTGRLVTGPGMQCNVVQICPGMAGRPDSRTPLPGLVDPTIVDRGSRNENRDRCRQSAISQELVPQGCQVDASPALMCLDANGAAGGPSPTGDIIVTVGAGAGSGDFPFADDDAAGTGGTGALGTEQGGI